jgi:glycosidase
MKLVITLMVLAAFGAAWADGPASPPPQQTARTSPDWLQKGVIYEIFPRDFSPAGNLNGVTARLDDLKDLGVNILWIMPIQPIGEKARKGEYGSPYSIRDYYAINPDYGTPDDFKRMVIEAHKRGMKVIMDVVANHTAWDSVMMAHPEFYKHDANGNIISPVPTWTDVAALNYQDPKLRQYMIAMLKYWVQTYNVDGFRCDAAAMIPTDFWEEARAALQPIKPDIMMLAEASKPELLTNAFDIDYNWPLLGTMDKVLIDGYPASDIKRTWMRNQEKFPKNALHMQVSDDHDEARAVNRYGLKGALAASTLMFTLDGVPVLYNGMEIGDANSTDGDALFKKLNISWDSPNHPELRAVYHDLIQMRHEYPVFSNSSVDWVHNSDESRLLTFVRADGRDEILVVINFSSEPFSGKVDLKNADGFTPVKIAGMQNSDEDPLPTVHLGSFEWCIYHRAQGSSVSPAHLADKKSNSWNANQTE